MAKNDINDLWALEVGLGMLVTHAAQSAQAAQAGVTVEVKTGLVQSLVTEADRVTERMLVRELRERYPDCLIIGEEGTGHETVLGDEPTFVIDPIDGTLGYANGLFDIWGVSAAMLKCGVPQAAAIWADGHVYTTYLNSGRVLRDHMPFVPREPNPKALPLVNIGLLEWFGKERGLALVGKLWDVGLQQTTFVSCVAECAALLEGRLRANLQPGLALWDLAATALLVQEAGLVARRWSGEEIFPGVWNRVGEDRGRFLKKQVYAFDFLYAQPDIYDRLAPIIKPYAGILAA